MEVSGDFGVNLGADGDVGLVVSLVCWVVGDVGDLGEQGMHLREQCVCDPRCAVVDLVVPVLELSRTVQVAQIPCAPDGERQFEFVVAVVPILAFLDEIVVGKGCHDVVGMVLEPAGEDFRAHFCRLLFSLVDHVVQFGDVGCATIRLVGFGRGRGWEQRQDRDLVAFELGVVVEWGSLGDDLGEALGGELTKLGEVDGAVQVVDGTVAIVACRFEEAAEGGAKLGDVAVVVKVGPVLGDGRVSDFWDACKFVVLDTGAFQ